MTFRKKILSSLLLCLFPVTSVFGDAIFMKDGKILFGKIQKESERDLTLQIKAIAGSRVILRSEVLRILYKDEIPFKYIYLTNGDKRRAFIVDENARLITIRDELENMREEKIARKMILSVSETELKTTSLPFLFKTRASAKKVSLEGDFSGWQSVQMEKDAADDWQVSLPIDILKKSEYEYRFIIDGKPQPTETIRLTAENGKLVELIDHYDWRLQLAGGAHAFAAGYADNLTSVQPAIGVGLAFRLPLLRGLPKGLHLRADGLFFRDRPSAAALPFFNGLSVETLNFSLVGSAGWRTFIWSDSQFALSLGGGVILQDTHTQGFRTAHVTNTIPVVQMRGSLAYPLTRRIALILPVIVLAEFDAKVTFVGSAMLGLEFAL